MWSNLQLQLVPIQSEELEVVFFDAIKFLTFFKIKIMNNFSF